jgi:transcriptional regulator with XRE-family HTH domain
VSSEHFGYLLREARLKAGRSIEEIARRTKIPVPTLERLESGDPSQIAADVFVCGFLRAYAREVGLDGEEAVARYRRAARLPEPVYESAEPLEPLDNDPPAKLGSINPPTEGSIVDQWIGQLTARVPMLESVLGRRPAFALVVLLVVVVATITLSLLLGGDPRPGRGLS